MARYVIPRIPARQSLPLPTWERAHALLESPGAPFLLPGGQLCLIVGEYADAQRRLESMRLFAWTLTLNGPEALACIGDDDDKPSPCQSWRRGQRVHVARREYVLDRYVVLDADVPPESAALAGVDAARWLSAWLRMGAWLRGRTDEDDPGYEIIDWMHMYQHPVAIVRSGRRARVGIMPYVSASGAIDCVLVDARRPDLMPAHTLRHHPHRAVA